MGNMGRIAAVVLVLVGMVFGQPALVLDGSLLERTFNGIGGLSGGGATSRFLPSYEEPYIGQILDYLFLPNFGASLHILKVEIGGDCQTTEGTESSHMHTREDLSFERGYEWWLMQEAKKRNPDILLYALSWGVPGWIGNGSFFTQDNIDYHIKWLQGAKEVYGLDINYIGVWNERGYEIDWILEFRAQLNTSGFVDTLIVGHDAGWDIVSDMQTNAQLKKDVAIVGVHYPGTTSPTNAQQLGTPLWASEDYSSFSDSTGGGCWARILNQNYVNGYMTATISWNLVASYYQALPYQGDGLMWAEYPWSGNYEVTSPIWVTAHTTQFTQPGWVYLAHGNGTGLLPSGGSYVTLVPPGSPGDFTLIIETMSHDNSVCIRPGLPPYNISTQTVTFDLIGGLFNDTLLYVWYTHLNQNQSNTYFEMIKVITPQNGSFTMELDVDSVWTVTTLSGGRKGSYPPPPPPAGFPSPYSDDFNNYSIGSEANYFDDQTGVWEIFPGAESLVMRQQVTIPPITWCGESNRPISLIGDFMENDAILSVMALIEVAGSVGVGLRAQFGGCGDNYAEGYFFSVQSTGMWNMSVGHTSVESGTINFHAEQFYNLTISATGPMICAYVDGATVVCINDTKYVNGFASIGSGWNYAQFDNFSLVRTGPDGCGTGDFALIMPCVASSNQIWNYTTFGTLELGQSGVCLEVNGTDPVSGKPSVRTLPCDPQQASQIWKFDSSTSAFISALNGDCLDITSQSTNVCAAVEVYPCNQGTNQQWYMQDGQIITQLDEMCLTGQV